METKRLRPSPGERASRRYKEQYLYRQTPLNKTAKKSKAKLHWSRLPRQLQKDSAILAMFGLEFKGADGKGV